MSHPQPASARYRQAALTVPSIPKSNSSRPLLRHLHLNRLSSRFLARRLLRSLEQELRFDF
jgi:hypothetical protein